MRTLVWQNFVAPDSSRRLLRFWLLFVAFCLTISLSAGCNRQAASQQPVTLVFSNLTFTAQISQGATDVIHDFTRQTGIQVKVLPFGQSDMTERRLKQIQWLKGGQATPDVYEVDVIDVGELAPYLLDLRPFVTEDDRDQMAAIMRVLTVNGRLVALPVHTDIGLLFYRTDLLKKYGFSHPPKTWDELEHMATRIQAGERAGGDKEFWGFIWEGSPQDEGLAYTALEWQASAGGGTIIQPDRTISINNPWAIGALRRARSWVGTISPPSVTAYDIADLSNAWLAGRAAFMRDWPYVYAIGQRVDSASRGKFSAAPLPAGIMGSAGALGGWQVAVSKYSAHPKEAVELVQYLTSRRMQLFLGRTAGILPTHLSLYDDPQLLQADPYFLWLKAEFNRIAVARPSAAAGDNYLAVSDAYKQTVHSILSGQADPSVAIPNLEKQLVRITGFPARRPLKPLPFAAVGGGADAPRGREPVPGSDPR